MGILRHRVVQGLLIALSLTSAASASRADEPTYSLIPIFGVIGTEVTAAALEGALADVAEHDPDYLVLCFDTPGGYVQEMHAIARVLEKHRHRKLVAFVKRGISCGAVLAMSCPTVVVYPDAAIGAALPWKQGPDGIPQAIEEKFLSVARAEMRSLAGTGGHSELLLRGMMEPDLELALVLEESGPKVVERIDALTAKVIKEKGRILTLTGRESLECGLAAGVAANVGELRAVLGPDTWHKAGDGGWETMLAHRRTQQAREQQQQRQVQRLRKFEDELVSDARRRVERFEEAKPQLERLDDKIAEASAEADAARMRLERLAAELQVEVAGVQVEHQKKVADAEREKRLKDRALAKHEATQELERRRAEIGTKYLPLIKEHEERLSRAADRLTRLAREREELLADVRR